MADKFHKKQTPIEFSVDGKPPKKTKPSLWSKGNNQVPLVHELRKKADEASKNAELHESLQGPVKLTLTVFHHNPLERKDRDDYLGDLDALIGGVIEVLQPLPDEINKLEIDPLLKEKNDNKQGISSIITDDAQITTTISQKRNNIKKKEPYYTVLIEKDYEFWWI